ncbi:MAG: hypothetical protein LBD53_10650 [Tannerella sp.]|nr:hypothetical protein [Tannerella sp.]
MRTLYYLTYALSALLIIGCIEENDLEQGFKGAGEPVMASDATVDGKTASSIQVTAKVDKENGSPVTDRGFCYGTSPSPTIANSTKISDTGKGIGSYSLTITGLSNNTLYYIRAYATNSYGTVYIDLPPISTNPGLGVVETTPPSDIHATSAKTGGTIILPGEGSITTRGVYYSVNKDFTGALTAESTDNTDTYICNLTNLLSATKYYVKAFVTNTYGTFEGTVDSITTLNGLGVVETLPPTGIYAASATLNGKITDAGEGSIIKRGIYLSLNKEFTAIDTIYCPKDTAIYSCPLNDLTPATKYYVKAFVINTFGLSEATNIDSMTTRNGLPSVGATVKKIIGFTDVTLESVTSALGDTTVTIIERGFCWATSPAPEIDDDTVRCGVGEGTFDGVITGLVAQRQYFARPYARTQFGPAFVVYGEEVSFYTKTDVPTVRTDSVTSIANGKATVVGTLIDQGSAPVTQAGIVWSLVNPTPTKTDFVLTLTVAANNSFTGLLQSLRGGQTVYFRAFATNSQGTSYGDVISFTTPPVFITSLPQFPVESALPGTSGYFSVDGYLFVLGGDIGVTYSDALWRFSISENKWLQMKSFPGGNIKWPTCIKYGAGAYVSGGVNDTEDQLPNVYQYNAYQNLWNSPITLNDTTYLMTGFSHGSSIYYVGGKRDTINHTFSPPSKGDTVKADVRVYGAPAMSPEAVTLLPEPQYGGFALTHNNEVFAGMGNDTTDVCNNKIWVSSDLCATWTLQTVCTINTGSIFGAVECRNMIYMLDEDYYILEYNQTANVWTRKSQLPSGYRKFNCIFSYGNKLYIGFGTAGNLLEYDPAWDN